MCALLIEFGGPCQALPEPFLLKIDDGFVMWGFDKNMKACRKFFYEGCGGNANRFSTKEKCMKDCEPLGI